MLRTRFSYSEDGRDTVAEILDNENRTVCVGSARRHTKDKPKKAVGRRLALNRATRLLVAAFPDVQPVEIKNVWDRYFLVYEPLSPRGQDVRRAREAGALWVQTS